MLKHCNRFVGLVAAMVVATVARPSHGAPIVGDTFDSNMDGWEVRPAQDATTIGQQPALDGRTGVIQIEAAAGDLQDYVLADSSDGELAGNKDYVAMGIQSVTFQFYAGADDGGQGGGVDIPADLRLYFVSAGSVEWYYDIDPTAGWAGAYFGYGANFAAYSGWYSETARDQSLFMGDLTDVDEIGLEITYQAWDGQVYGIDDFNLNDQAVPEPETYAILGFTVLSLGLVLARKRRTLFAFDLA